MSRLPLPRYPNGWFQVAYSDEVPAGAVLPLKYFGKDLVIFRDEDGVLAVLDAHCPHLGAHLGYGGRMEGKCVRCPFHAWLYDASGKCVSVPYSDKAPPARAKVRAWTVREVNGLVMVWHHAEGIEPTFEIPVNAEYGSDDWTPYEKARWKIKTHNQEMAENAVDSAHFHYVHGTVERPTSQATVDGVVLRVLSQTRMRTPMGKVSGTVESISHGFGYSVTRFTGIVDTLLAAGVTAIDEDYVDVRFSFMVRKQVDRAVTSTVGEHFMAEIKRQLAQDIPIWENKIYIDPPLVVDNDGPIGIFRRWTKQFYSEPGAAASRGLPVTAG